jgi:hypothetical protein
MMSDEKNARLRALLYHADSYVIDGIAAAKSNVEMNKPYPRREQRYQADLDEALQLHADIVAALSASDEPVNEQDGWKLVPMTPI